MGKAKDTLKKVGKKKQPDKILGKPDAILGKKPTVKRTREPKVIEPVITLAETPANSPAAVDPGGVPVFEGAEKNTHYADAPNPGGVSSV